MPELPEVETIRQGLVSLAGRQIADVEIWKTRSVQRHLPGPHDFQTRLAGLSFAAPKRRGKYLWFPLDSGDAMVAHLGMSGQFRLDASGAEYLRHTRVVWHFSDGGNELRFVDQRMFGGVFISFGGAELPDEVSHIALDPVDPAFSAIDLAHRLRASSRGIKRLLLDQTVVSGIGNIYANEALWRSRLHYAAPG
ncbi:MAG: DNA-formamidopyrimidine glycosylase family protein, partial [Propionibacteriaceae bacterium]